MSKVSCAAAGKCRRHDFANGARGTGYLVVLDACWLEGVEDFGG